MSAIGTLLVANRGEIARRVFRTARAMGMRCVAVFSDADSDAPFVTEADVALRLPAGYLDAEAVVAAAVAAGADAVHPGYGFLAENSGFARAVVAAGLAWVGPAPEAIETMGDKLAAKAAAEAAGVPTLPSSEDPAEPGDVGFPLMVKAAAGGGGKGMRLVSDPADLPEAVAAARREALGGFGDDTLFLERYLRRCRHIEVQVLGDTHGNVVHLGERECSIQRRHQKIIEESPSTAVDDALRSTMGDAAVRLAKAIGYCSAGTVELLLDDDTGEFFFLEVNTRLQVEHPVTEEVTGIDLVREQLRVAAGEPLGYGQADIAYGGHAIEARLYAEDPAAGFLPAVGTLAAFAPPADPAVRWDSGVEAGSEVGLDFDPMLAKVIAHAPTRAEAAGRLALALERLHIAGVTTNRHFLASALRSEAFLAGDTTTDFIERADPSRAPAVPVADCQRAASAAALWLQAVERSEARTLGWIPSGWRHGRLPPERVELAVETAAGPVEVVVSYRPQRDGTFVVRAECGDSATEAPARIAAWSPETLDFEWSGRRIGYAVAADGDRVHLTGDSETVTVTVLPRFGAPEGGPATGGFAAPMPGVIVEVRVQAGDQVTAGSTLVVMEGMKMEHHVSAPCDGTVTEVLVAAGDQVDNGTPLLVFDPTGPSDG
ncbi:MAG: ATP-grasp domain-containing protein [Acidimicrobiaceae bacterium]|nr:ATP-grasp domain-containing protein [Acidimicrobiaceae bacterium]